MYGMSITREVIMNCYKVTVETTNATGNTTCNREGGDKYNKVEKGVCYVITDKVDSIYQKFGAEQIKSVEKIGIGYQL